MKARIFRLLGLTATALCLTAQERPGELTVAVDPRLELLSVVQQLSDYAWTGLLNTDDAAYRREVMAWFAPAKDHPAVQNFSLAARYGYAYDAPVSTMVCLSPPPALVLESAADCGAARAGGAANLEVWLGQLRDFAVQSRFNEFFEAHRSLYAGMEEQTRAKLPANYGHQLEEYFGVRQTSFAVLLAPLMRGNYGVRVPQPDSTFATFAVIGAVGSSRDTYQFSDAVNLRALLWHEFGHSFVNPVIDANEFLLTASAQLYPPIDVKMRAQAYGNWRTAVIEHVVRAMVAGMMALYLTPSDGDIELLRQRGQGFAYISALYQRLRGYEGNRDAYPRFADFAPRLLAVFDELSAQEFGPTFFRAPYARSINSVVTEKDRIVIVIPTGETDKTAEGLIRNGAQRVRDVLYPSAPVIEDREALQRDLSGNPVLAYGTLDGNLWLQRYRDRFPVTLRNGKAVVGDAEYAGERLRFIFSAPHPDNADSGIVVYTAANAADVVNINAISHGPTSWVAIDGAIILKTGDYVLRDGVWTLP